MESNSIVKEFIAGQMAGFVGICLVYPLDTAKIRLQTSSNYSSTYHVLSSMVKIDGVRALYRGIPAPAMGFGLTFAISFSTYGESCRVISDYRSIEKSSLSYSDLFIAGAITGFVQTPARQIMERFKSVMQVRETNTGKASYKWTGDCMTQLIKREGWRNGLFQGMGSVFLREIPQFAIYYPTYEYAKGIFNGHFKNDTVAQFLGGGVAGIVQWLPPIYCTDVIKSRMQTSPPGFYKGVIDCAQRLYREEGFRVFFRGFSPALLRAFPLHATIFVVYENVMEKLGS